MNKLLTFKTQRSTTTFAIMSERQAREGPL